MAYIYQAEIYCDSCGSDICGELDVEGQRPSSVEDQSSYDSDDYPKRIGDDNGHGEADSPQHCGKHENCINAIILPSGTKIGSLLGTNLTSEGISYIVEAFSSDPDSEVVQYWLTEFGIYYREIDALRRS